MDRTGWPRRAARPTIGGCGNDAGRGVGDAGTTSRGWVSTRGRRPSRFARRTTSRRRGRGRRFTFHALRHTAATLLPSEGEHPKMVQELLGHAQVSLTLDRYSHMTPRLMSNAAVVMDRLLDEEA
jgi:integrase